MRATLQPQERPPSCLPLQVAALPTSRSLGPHLLAGKGGRGPPRVLSGVPQKLVELLKVPLQLTHVH